MPTVPPFIQQTLGVLVRAAVVWIAARFGAELSEDQAVQWTAQILPIVLVIGWSIYSKYVGRQKLMVALASPQVMTETQVEAKVSDPVVPTPSVNTLKTEVPQ